MPASSRCFSRALGLAACSVRPGRLRPPAGPRRGRRRHRACLLVLPRARRPQHLLDLPASRRPAKGLSDRAAHGVSRPHPRRSARADLYVGHGRAAERSGDRGARRLLSAAAAGSRARPTTRRKRRPAARSIPRASRPRACRPAWRCHGEKAEGNSRIPRLAGQHRAYIERQLEAFASNARANEIMHENSKDLTAEQIRDVAAYVGSL